MPGPRNMKKKKQAQAKKASRRPHGTDPETEKPTDGHQSTTSSVDITKNFQLPNTPRRLPIPPLPSPGGPVIPARRHVHDIHDTVYVQNSSDDSESSSDSSYGHGYGDDDEPIPAIFTQLPFIHDPGNGPRVRDMRAFLASSFAAPPSLDDPLCAAFAEKEMIEMLSTVLPEETALVLWYNRSRQTARICPACQRLYRMGDPLPELLEVDVDEEQPPKQSAGTSPFLRREQELSGLCSPVCFVLAAINYPGAIESTWGKAEEELDDETWDLLDGPGIDIARSDAGLSMLLKMTRCTDLGLGELFFPDQHLDPDYCEIGESDEDGGHAEELREVSQTSATTDSLTEDLARTVIDLHISA